MRTIENAILEIIQFPRRKSGASLFFKTQDSEISMVDESSLRTVVFEENTVYPHEDLEEVENQIEELHRKLHNLVIDKVGWSKVEDKIAHIRFISIWGDFIQIHITDNSLYFLSFASGQY